MPTNDEKLFQLISSAPVQTIGHVITVLRGLDDELATGLKCFNNDLPAALVQIGKPMRSPSAARRSFETLKRLTRFSNRRRKTSSDISPPVLSVWSTRVW
jgi:hypothetical protein